jgi:YfiH family protein
MTDFTSAHYLKSQLLERAGFRHAFFTRLGGVSEGPYASLNFSITVGDTPQNVNENLARAARALAVAPERLYFLSQVHGSDVREIHGTEARDDVLRIEGDALVGRSESAACGVRTADCVPILIADLNSGTVAAVHAGWRGVVRGIVTRCVQTLNVNGAHLLAAIGPHISLDAFEVSEDVARELEAVSQARDCVDRSRPKPHVDLRLIVRSQLETSGLRPQDIDDVTGCTLLEPELFFSFRRDGKHSGRHLSAIVPRVKGATP